MPRRDFGSSGNTETTVTLFDGATRVLGELGKRHAIGAITNGNADVHRIGIGHLFDFVVTPAEAGAAKPASAIFELALRQAGAPAQSVVHVGDDPLRDVRGRRGGGNAHGLDEPGGSAMVRCGPTGRRDSLPRHPAVRDGRLALTRISHQVTAADADMTIFAALNAARVLRVPLASQARSVPTGTPARPDSRSPCENSHLHALARNLGRVEDWRANCRVRWRFRRFRSGPQSGSLGHVSSPCSSNRACGSPAPGSL